MKSYYKKMSDKKWELAKTMKENWDSYQDIAKCLGCSKQLIAKKLCGIYTESYRRSDYSKCIYPNLKKYLYENRFSYNRFANFAGISSQALYNCLTGYADPSKSTIDRILSATNLSYEEAFKTEK